MWDLFLGYSKCHGVTIRWHFHLHMGETRPRGANLEARFLWRLRQEDHKLKASLGYWEEFQDSLINLVRPCLKVKTVKRGVGHGSMVEVAQAKPCIQPLDYKN